jgi:hypothetical protein
MAMIKATVMLMANIKAATFGFSKTPNTCLIFMTTRFFMLLPPLFQLLILLHPIGMALADCTQELHCPGECIPLFFPIP